MVRVDTRGEVTFVCAGLAALLGAVGSLTTVDCAVLTVCCFGDGTTTAVPFGIGDSCGTVAPSRVNVAAGSIPCIVAIIAAWPFGDRVVNTICLSSCDMFANDFCRHCCLCALPGSVVQGQSGVQGTSCAIEKCKSCAQSVPWTPTPPWSACCSIRFHPVTHVVGVTLVCLGVRS